MILTRLIAHGLRVPARALRSRRVRALLAQGETALAGADRSRAEACYRKAIELDPSYALAHEKLALLLTGSSRAEQALPHFREAHAVRALTGNALECFVRLLLQRGEHAAALDIAQQAAQAHAQVYESWFSLGLANLACQRDAQALACFGRALEIRPGSADAHANRGLALQNLGDAAAARAEYERALLEEPGHALARFHRSLALLREGDYAAGWPEYETRLVSADLPARPRTYPRCEGAATAGTTLLVYGEQGLGDEIMFASCVPDVIHAGARCVIECRAQLLKLFARSFPEATVYAAAADRRVPDAIHALGIDCEVPIGSLPLYYRRSKSDFPRHQGYLKADAARVDAWHARLAGLGPGMAVGLSWQGGTPASRVHLRSILPQALLPVLASAGVRFVSLQYTPDAPQTLRDLRERCGIEVAHWADAIADYDETAALVSALDLTLTVCTSVAHLAGALGKPVWIMAPKNPEWRYGSAGDTMPWFPSARVFRQQREGDWSDVIDAVALRLRAAAGAVEGHPLG